MNITQRWKHEIQENYQGSHHRHFSEDGWNLDKYGHLQKEIVSTNKATGRKTVSQHRIKFQATSCRLEKQVQVTGYGDKKKNEWFRVSSDYYSNILIEEDTMKLGSVKIKIKPLD